MSSVMRLSILLILLAPGEPSIEPIFRKCCGPKMMYNLEDWSCVTSTREFLLPERENAPKLVNVTYSKMVCPEGESIMALDPDHPSQRFTLSNVGSLLRKGRSSAVAGSFCLDNVASSPALWAFLCDAAESRHGNPLDLKADQPIIRKCCGAESMYDIEELGGCTKSTHDFQLPNPENSESFRIAYSSLIDCPPFRFNFLDPDDPTESFTLANDGSLIRHEGRVEPPETFCLDNVKSKSSVLAFICEPPDLELGYEDSHKTKLYTPFMFLSMVFLVLTFVVYAWIPKLRQISYSKCFMQMIVALFFFYVFQATVYIIGRTTGDHLCTYLGFAVQFFFLATFFWLNVMCIDIYWAFSDLRSLGGSAGTWRDQRKLLCYSAYAWGMPLLILGVTIAVDYSPSIPSTSRFKPAMGVDKCFFRGRTAGWTYFYGPMAIILLINCVLFAITAFHLYRHRRDAGFTNRGDSRRHGGGNDKERFNLYLKLFIVMGINWLSEVVSFTFNKDVPRYLWYLTDITNTLQGVFIFLIFVWKQRVRQLIWDKLCKGNRSGSTANNTSSTSITTNSTRSHHNSIKMANINNVVTAPIK